MGVKKIQLIKLLTPFRPNKSAMRPLVTAPIIAPTVTIEPKIEYCTGTPEQSYQTFYFIF